MKNSKDGYLLGTSSAQDNEVSFADIIPQTPSQSDEDEFQSEYHRVSSMYCTINSGKEDEIICHAYKRSYIRTALQWILIVCTAGLAWLVFYWRPDWELLFTHYKCSFNEKVDSVLLLLQDGTDRKYVEKVDKISRLSKSYAPHLFKPKICSEPNSVQNSPSLARSHETNFNVDAVTYDSGEGEVLRFYHHYDQFIWSDNEKSFIKVEGFDKNLTVQNVLNASDGGLSSDEQNQHRLLYNKNVIEVEIPSYLKLLLLEVLNPFYVFQLFACVFWMVDEYVVYATAILVISFISAVVSLITIRQERQNLHDMVMYHNKSKVNVLRHNQSAISTVSSGTGSGSFSPPSMEEIWTEDLVPGDVVVIPAAGTLLSFDAALVSGTCIVNESMLTGESIPVTKTPLTTNDSNQVYDVDQSKLHTLYCGTQVIQTRYYRDEFVKAIVVRTGFQTSKGKLVHSILFPKPADLKLFRDAYRFVGVLFLIAMLGFIYTVVYQAKQGESVHDIMFNAIDLITITVPPALPLALTIGIIYAQQRMKKQKINCISPQRINIAGQVDLTAFDKTGTLTEDSLNLAEVLTVNSDSSSSKFTFPSYQPSDFSDTISINYDNEILRCMTTCHCLTRIDGNIVGDPLDVKMFEATKWELVEPKVDDESKFDQLQTTYVRPPKTASFEESVTISSEIISNEDATSSSSNNLLKYELGIVRQFPFTSSLQTSSVIVRPLKSEGKNKMLIYVKGAPEKIQGLCRPESIPPDFRETLKYYTQNGYRVIALSGKTMTLKWIKAQKIERELIESDLNFLGLLILQNKLKPNTCDILKTLNDAQIRSVMITGDNILTAISVARECNIIKSNIPLLVAKTTPPSDDYNVIGTTSGQPPTLTWELSQETSKDRRNSSSLPSIEKIVDKSLDASVICMNEDSIPSCQLAVSGRDYAIIKQYFPEYCEALAYQGAVFARMSPKQKTMLIEDFQDLDYHVCMCGDGANDCGALKAAHVGLSLSEYEASVAAPFTANSDNGIESITTLIREGRAALVTSFGMFKFMALYSLIQFTTITILYNELSNLADIMYLYIDLIIIDLVALTMSRNHAYKALYWKKPAMSLISPEVLTSLIVQIILQVAVQVCAFLLVQQQCWFVTRPQLHLLSLESNTTNSSTTAIPVTTMTPNYTDCPALANVVKQPSIAGQDPDSYSTTTLFYLSSFMYLSVSIAFSRGHPFRTRIYKNRLFLLCLLFLTIFTLILMFIVPVSWNDFIVLAQIPDVKFLVLICIMALAHLVVCVVFEVGLIENFAFWRVIRQMCSRVATSVKRYKQVSKILNGEVENNNDGDYVAIPWLDKDQTLVPNNGRRLSEVDKTRL